MFTGLVQAVGYVAETRPLRGGRGARQGLRLTIDPRGWLPAPETPALGDSICVSGVCLTVAAPVDPRRPRLVFDAVEETLQRTNLGSLKRGSRVNLERSATMATLLGGHLVQGHVDGTGVVHRVKRDAGDWRVWIEVPLVADRFDPMTCIVPKGSITLDGVSLTVVDAWSDKSRRGFHVALIPTTLEKTTLGSLKRGSVVNLEADVIGKTVVTWLERYLPGQRTPKPITRKGRRA